MRRVSSKCSDRLIAALLLVAAGGVSAQVNRCTGDGDRLRYTDRSCETLGLQRDADISQRLAGVVLVPVDVSGRDAVSLQSSLAERGPAGFHASAEWEVGYRYRVAPAGDGRCRVTGIQTTLTGRLRLPRWTDEASAPPALKAAWTRYLDALSRHEDGHLANGLALAKALSAEVVPATAADCKTLRADIETAARRLIEEHQARDRRYDRETDHGATQGARFVSP